MPKKIPSGAKMLSKRPTIEQNVKQILKDFPPTKGDDLLLIFRYWKRHDKIRISFAKFKDLLGATCPETIRRSRQKIQAQHPEFKPRERTRLKRKKNQEAHANYYGRGGFGLLDYLED